MGVIEVRNGHIVQSQLVDLDLKEYDVIPAYPNKEKYSRAEIKRNTRKALDRYYETNR